MKSGVNKQTVSENGIKKKLLSAVVIVVVITIVAMSAIKIVSDLSFRNKSDEILINQAKDSAEIFVSGQTDAVNEQMVSIIEKIDKTSANAEYIYQHPDEFASKGKHVTEFPKDTTGVTYHWATFSEEDDKSRAGLKKEADMLSALQGEFYSLMKACPMIQSLYIATASHINIGYDEAVLAKTEGYYDPSEKNWFKQPMETGKTYISSTYPDNFGRGLFVTIAVPYSVGGKPIGVIGADINIENIQHNILDIDMNGNTGYAVLLAADGTPISAKNLKENTTAKDLLGSKSDAIVKDFATKENGVYESDIDGAQKYVLYDTVDITGWKLGVILSVDDILAPTKTIDTMIIRIAIISIVISLVLLAIMLIFVGRFCNKFTEPIVSLTKEVGKIGNGNLDYVSNVHTGDEIETLSKSFENMTVSLKEYIENLTYVTAEKERIGADLAIATQIQSSMLPCIFPPFPEMQDRFNIYATMNPAKEVGGDFYDFFMVDPTHLAIVVADVSGKGVPAALFMVIGKTLIKDHTTPENDLGMVFTVVNRLLCEANSEGMFITAFEGVIDLETGVMNYVNAGHETPFICHKGEKFIPHKVQARFVLAGMDGMTYKAGTFQLEKGDKVFQYTDGVTEATNANNELYGMERLEKVLGENSDKSPEELLPAVKADIDKFVGDAPQFDDITMLGFEYLQ